MSVAIIDNLWLLLASVLVLSMQAGFLLLEAGRVRAKNSVNVAQKNVADLVTSWSVFILFGYWLMFGSPGPIGGPASTSESLYFLYQLGFCATAASIVSGGVAERMGFHAYLALAALTAAIIYPLVGRWVWSGLGPGASGSWLAELGFIDFAGATVVHGVGAWVALAGIHAIGPRLGRFHADGSVRTIPGHNAVLSLTGVLILLIGWFGFNAGALSPTDPRFAPTILSTLAAAAFGALAGMIAGAVRDRGVFNPSRISSGLIGGLVAITACADLTSTHEAMLLGLLGGAIATLGSDWLLYRWRIDDPVDVVATHGLAGGLGTLAVAFVGDAAALPAGSRVAQFVVQLVGVLTVFAFSYLCARAALILLARWHPLRVTELQERLGLNQTEHGEALGTERLQNALQQRLDGVAPLDGGAPDQRLDVEAGDEAAELAVAMNALLDRQDLVTQRIIASEARFEQFANTASDWLWETDARLCLVFVSVRNGLLDDASRAALIGRSIGTLLRVRHADARLVQQALRRRLPIPSCEVTLLLDGGARRTMEMRGVAYADASGRFLGYRGTFHDVTERHDAERHAVFLSHHDTLTGLANRRALAARMQRRGARARPGAGRGVAAGGRGGGRPHDQVFRTGGDEFVLVLPAVPLGVIRDVGRQWGDRLIGALSAPYDVEDSHGLLIGASIGLAFSPEHADDCDALVHLADLALYAAKAAGKGQVVCFEPRMDADARKQVELEELLRTALDNGELSVQYQPQYQGRELRLAGFEALLRWNSPSLGAVPPDVFIPVAERTGLMPAIGLFVLRTACHFAAGLNTQDGESAPDIAVNVSPSQFEQAGFVEQVRTVLEQSALPAGRLELEITEQLLVRDFDRMCAQCVRLRALGVSIAVDDFGSGQTSLGYLNRLPISKLKIDRAFVAALDSDVRAQEITRSIVKLAHKLGCTVVAEGVEHGVQAGLLDAWACDEKQGYLYARPMSADDATELLRSGRGPEAALRQAG